MKIFVVFPSFIKFIFVVPILVGIFGVLLPSFGYFPEIGGNKLSLDVFGQLIREPTLPNSILLTIFSGISSTLISLILAIFLSAIISSGDILWTQKRILANFILAINKGLISLIAIPHAAIALGFAFLISPSGWIIRWISFGFSDWDTPPELETLQDSMGISLILGLLLKETPYLLLMILISLPQIKYKQYIYIGQSLGYGLFDCWLKLILPQIYPLIRLPVFAVLVFSLSVVDVALILGPTTPPTLSILIMQWMENPDINFRFVASAGAVLLFLISFFSIVTWRFLEWVFLENHNNWQINGKRRSGKILQIFTILCGVIVVVICFLNVLCLLFWSFSNRWAYPNVLPSIWTLSNWARYWNSLQETILITLEVGLISTTIALFLAIGYLENENYIKKKVKMHSFWWIYLPLLVPQATFLLGIQILSISLHLDGTMIFLIWSHLLFVLPYIFLSFSDSWRSLDHRMLTTAQCLGSSPLRNLFRIKLPVLFKPLLVTMAIGLSVSIAQYLPTLFAGGGRFSTLTTEAVSLASSGDMRVIGVFAFLQSILPLIGILLAFLIPKLFYRHRSEMT